MGAQTPLVHLSVSNVNGDEVELTLTPAKARQWAKDLEARADALQPLPITPMSGVEMQEQAEELSRRLAKLVIEPGSVTDRKRAVHPAVLSAIRPPGTNRMVDDRLTIAVIALEAFVHSMIDISDGGEVAGGEDPHNQT